MATINTLLDEAKEKMGGISDNKLGAELGCSSQVLSNWRVSKGEPDKYACWRLAEITGRDLYEIIAIIEAERDKRPEVKAFFEKILETGAYKKVAVALVGAAALTSPFGAGDAGAAPLNVAYKQMFIM
jgi:hypothetical protein